MDVWFEVSAVLPTSNLYPDFDESKHSCLVRLDCSNYEQAEPQLGSEHREFQIL